MLMEDELVGCDGLRKWLEKRGQNIEAIEAALAQGKPVYTLNPQRGWVVSSVSYLRRAIAWHRQPENRRMQWRSDLYAV